MMRVVVTALFLMLAACGNPFAPDVPDGAAATEPHPAFSSWWSFVEKDTGQTGDFDRIQWFKVAGGTWIIDGKATRGMRTKSRIYIADIHWTTGSVVRHEMLHMILDGDPDHEHPLFATPNYNFTLR